MQKLQTDKEMISREVSKDGLAFIKSEEGLSRTMYLDANGKATIGYGHLITPDELEAYKNGIDLPTAERIFRRDIKHFADLVNYTTRSVTLTQNQFDMLVSFVYNIGYMAYLRSTLLRDIQLNRLNLVSKEMNRWVHGDHGKLLKGLVKRRYAEARIFDGKLDIQNYLGTRMGPK